MNNTTSEIDKLRMKKQRLVIELNTLQEKVKIIEEDKKLIDYKIMSLISLGKDDGAKNFRTSFT